jgi:hypothetical protein
MIPPQPLNVESQPADEPVKQIADDEKMNDQPDTPADTPADESPLDAFARIARTGRAARKTIDFMSMYGTPLLSQIDNKIPEPPFVLDFSEIEKRIMAHHSEQLERDKKLIRAFMDAGVPVMTSPYANRMVVILSGEMTNAYEEVVQERRKAMNDAIFGARL